MRFRQWLTAVALGAIAVTMSAAGPGEAARRDRQATTKPPINAPVPPGVRLVDQIPAPGPPRPFQFPAIATHTLANGVKVFVVSDHREPAVTAALVLPDAGAVHDPPGKVGVAQMTANLLTQGTTTRSARQIAQAIDFAGGSLSVFAGDDDTTAVVTIVKKDFALGMDLLSDVVLHPSFPQQEIDRQRQQALSSMRVEYSDAGYLASVAIARMIFGSNPYGFPDEGTPESLGRISRDDLVHFQQSTYGPQDALLAFAGDIAPDQAYAAAEKYFGEWSQTHSTISPPAGPPATSGLHVLVIDKPDAVQTQIRVGRAGVARDDPNYVPLLVANRIFGGGYNSLLNTAVRIQKGLTYGANSAFQSRRFGGSFEAATFTRTEESVPAVKLVVDLMARMASGEITDSDLDLARDYLVGVYPIQTETPEQVVTRVLTVAEYGLPADDNQTYPSRVGAVSLDQVKQMARRYFDAKNLDIVLVGNASGFREALKQAFPNAAYEEIPADQLDFLQPSLRKEAVKIPAATPASLEQGHSALASAAAAAGGPAISAVKTIQVTESGQIFSAQGQVNIDETYQVSYPDHFHSEFAVMGQKITQVYDGENGWMTSAQGSAQLPPDLLVNLRRRVLLTEGIGLYQQMIAGKVRAQWLGEEQVQGQTFNTAQWNSNAGAVTLLIDSRTQLVTGATYTATSAGSPVETTEVWSDFREVQGVKLPFHLVAYQAGAKFMEVNIKDLKVNVPVSPALFNRPRSQP